MHMHASSMQHAAKFTNSPEVAAQLESVYMACVAHLCLPLWRPAAQGLAHACTRVRRMNAAETAQQTCCCCTGAALQALFCGVI
jgi:hypothetical protein